MTKEILACPDIDGKDTRKQQTMPVSRNYQIQNKEKTGEIDNPAGENGKEVIYNVTILEITSGTSKQISNVTWINDSDDCLENLFKNGN
jgi:hypothetical protein